MLGPMPLCRPRASIRSVCSTICWVPASDVLLGGQGRPYAGINGLIAGGVMTQALFRKCCAVCSFEGFQSRYKCVTAHDSLEAGFAHDLCHFEAAEQILQAKRYKDVSKLQYTCP